MLEAVAPPALSLGSMIDALFDLRAKKWELEERAAEIGKIMEGKEAEIMAALETQGLDKATGRKARVGVNESVVPQMENWDEYWAYIRRHNAFELLERRPAAAAWREHAARRRDKTVPGTVPYTKRKLSLTVNK